jgi:hypothetical protein
MPAYLVQMGTRAAAKYARFGGPFRPDVQFPRIVSLGEMAPPKPQPAKRRLPTPRRLLFPRGLYISSHPTSSLTLLMHLSFAGYRRQSILPLYLSFFGRSDCALGPSIPSFPGGHHFHVDRNKPRQLAHTGPIGRAWR